MKKEVDTIGRRLDISAEKWLELVAEFRKSDLPLKEFAASKGVNPHTFRYWTNDREKRLPLMTNQNMKQLLPENWLAEIQKRAA